MYTNLLVVLSLAVRFGSSKPNCLSSTAHIFHRSSATSPLYLFSNSVTLPFVNILDVSLQTKPCSGTPCLCQNLYHQITFLSVGKYRHRSNIFSASYTRTKEPPHVTSPYSSCTSSQKLYQIQFVTPPLL